MKERFNNQIDRLADHGTEVFAAATLIAAMNAILCVGVSAEERKQAEVYAKSGQSELSEDYNRKADKDLGYGIGSLLPIGAGIFLTVEFSKEKYRKN